MTLETIEYRGTRYAEVIRGDMRVVKTQFFSPPESSFQFGLLTHEAGFAEPPHYHNPFPRNVTDLQQMFVMQRGRIVVELYSDEGDLLREIELKTGDAIVLIHGIHALRVLEDFQAVSVKQGPFLGTANDKVNVKVKKPFDKMK
jgi:hypothetical protein